MSKHETVGVIVARFQVPEPHKGHRWLIDQVSNDYDKVVLLIGQTNLRPNVRDWLPFEFLKMVLQPLYPYALILPFQDSPISNIEWSQRLDTLVRSLPNGENATLCGSRDSFRKSYTGSIPVRDYETHGEYSATEIRAQLLNEEVPSDPASLRLFLHGVLYGVNSVYRYPIPDATVDGAIHTADWSKVLMIRRSPELPLRFFGGFVDESDKTSEDAVAREHDEEVGSDIRTKDPVYVASWKVDDPRLPGTGLLIRTILFAKEYLGGGPILGDDMSMGEYEWCDLDESLIESVVEEHRELLQFLLKHKQKQLTQ